MAIRSAMQLVTLNVCNVHFHVNHRPRMNFDQQRIRFSTLKKEQVQMQIFQREKKNSSQTNEKLM